MIIVIGIVGIVTGIGTWDMLKQINKLKQYVQYRDRYRYVYSI